jgi:hypothetical protein
MELSQDFKEFIEALNANDVRYLLVGGYAVVLHGHPRLTKDIDFWIPPERENARRALHAIEQFGLASVGTTLEDLTTPGMIVQFGVPPLRIDLITELEGIDFETCYKKRVKTEISGISVNLIDIESLKKNKRATGRHQDLADAENLEKPKSKRKKR